MLIEDDGIDDAEIEARVERARLAVQLNTLDPRSLGYQVPEETNVVLAEDEADMDALRRDLQSRNPITRFMAKRRLERANEAVREAMRISRGADIGRFAGAAAMQHAATVSEQRAQIAALVDEVNARIPADWVPVRDAWGDPDFGGYYDVDSYDDVQADIPARKIAETGDPEARVKSYLSEERTDEDKALNSRLRTMKYDLQLMVTAYYYPAYTGTINGRTEEDTRADLRELNQR